MSYTERIEAIEKMIDMTINNSDVSFDVLIALQKDRDYLVRLQAKSKIMNEKYGFAFEDLM